MTCGDEAGNLDNPFREPLVYSSPRRKPWSGLLILLDSGLRRNGDLSFNQRFLSVIGILTPIPTFPLQGGRSEKWPPSLAYG